MKKLLCLILALCCLFALAACGESETTGETEGTVTAPITENQVADTTETPENTDTQTGTKPTPSIDENTVEYTIKVVDEAGNPVAAATIAQICDEVCVPVKLTDGVGTKSLEANENYHVNLTVMPEGFEYASGETEYYFDETNTCTIVLKAVA